MSTAETIVAVPGMHCAGCARGIEKVLAGLDGIERLAIDSTRRRAVISHDPAAIAPTELLHAVRRVQPGARLADVSPTRAPVDDLVRIAVSGVLGMQVMMLAFAMYSGAGRIEPDTEYLLRIASLLFSIPIVFYAALPFFRGAWRTLRNTHTLDMDAPVATAVAATFAASAIATLGHDRSAPVYFDSVAMFVFLLLLARFLADRLRGNFESEVSPADLLPAECLRVGPAEQQRIPVAAVRVGDRLRVAPGESIPMDGRVSAGTALLDESLLSGESVPVLRGPGEPVFAATTSVGGSFDMQVTTPLSEARFRRVAQLADAAVSDAPSVTLADRLAGVFVAVVMALAASTWIVWRLIDPGVALPASVAVLVVACPCALSLATPAAVTAALLRLRRAGIVVTRAAALDRLTGLRSILFDKTGTLTRSTPRIEAFETLADLPADACMAVAAALERNARHPFARAFEAVAAAPARDLDEVAGRGIAGTVNGRRYRLGTAAFCGVPGDAGRANVWLASDDGAPLATFDITAELRPGTLQTLEALARRNLHLLLASGDADAPCARFAPWLAVHPRQRPEDKLALLETLPPPTLVVGDGINDLPAMAGASVSATFVEARSLVRTRADVLLLGERLDGLLELLDTAARCRRIQRQNLAWAAAWNLLAIPAAAGGLLAPWAAALGMASSSLLVVANAARLVRPTRYRPATAGAAQVPA